MKNSLTTFLVFYSLIAFSQSWKGSLDTSGTIFRNGKVGIGTSNPTSKLQIEGGDISFGASRTTTRKLIFGNGDGTDYLGFSDVPSGSNALVFVQDGSIKFSIDGGTGNIGIGTTKTSFTDGIYKLSVNGKIRTQEVKVTISEWADFVFNQDYKLRSLNEVEQFIKQQKHLPGIPSKNEVLENGISLGSMNTKLLQKIEELTLYMIDLNKKIENLENENIKLHLILEKIENK